MTPRFAAPALILALTATTFAEEPDLKALRKQIDAVRLKSGVPGLAIAVVKDGKVVFSEGFGYRDVAKKLPVTPNTAFAIGSSSKAFTALLTTQAAVEGKLKITDRPSQYLPNFKLKDPDTNAKITLSDMMSHRSGLPRTDLAWYTGAFNRQELLELVGTVEPTAKLGEKWQYQNLMFVFTGMIDEKVYGKSYDTLLQERFFTPLGMTRSNSTYQAFTTQDERAVGYTPGGGMALPVHNIDVCAPAGAINSTVVDMSKYVTMLLADGQYEGKTLFSKDAIAETRKVRMSMAPGTPMNYGFGWMLHPFETHKMVEHGGNIDGFNAEVALLPDEHIGAVVLTNVSSSPAAMEAATTALKAFLPKAADKPDTGTPTKPPTGVPTKVTKADETPESRLGNYRLEIANIELRFYREGEKTFLEQDGHKIPLVLVGPGRYHAPDVPGNAFVTFSADPTDAKKTLAVLEQGGMKMPMKALEPYKAPLTGEALLAKVVEAQGGAAVLRAHQNSVSRYRAHMQSDGVDIYGIRYRRPMESADFAIFFALRRKFATNLSNCDGTTAGTYASFSPPSVKSGNAAASEILDANELADLEPARYYKSLVITKEAKVGNEDVYVLRKTPLVGGPVTVYVSKTSFRVLRQDQGALGGNTIFSDFRTIDGMTMPFHYVSSSSEGGKTIIDVMDMDYTARVPDWPFKAPKAK